MISLNYALISVARVWSSCVCDMTLCFSILLKSSVLDIDINVMNNNMIILTSTDAFPDSSVQLGQSPPQTL